MFNNNTEESNEFLSVSATCQLLQELVSAPGTMVVKGEVSDFIKSKAGHCYFTLKDQHAAIRCVLFAYVAQKQLLSIENGDMLIVEADASIYIKTGNLQLSIKKIQQPNEQGVLYAQFLALKNKLEKEGLFDNQHKKTLPQYPERVGIITSLTGAVRHDITITLQKRFPYAEIIIFGCLVQGEGAVKSILKALKHAEERSLNISCIIIGRGGGSMEDLMAFNDESIVRSLFACPIPTVSAVGHQTDVTLCDFVADARAATPTAAAELISPSQEELLLMLDEYEKLFKRVIFDQIKHHEQVCDLLVSKANNAKHYIEKQLYDIQIIATSYNHSARSSTQQIGAALNNLEQMLAANNPKKLLKNGLGYITDKNNKPIVNIAQLTPNQEINLQLKDGKAGARIVSIDDNANKDSRQ